MDFTVGIAQEEHISFAEEICEQIALSAKQRGTGRGKRSPEVIAEKIRNGQAIIATYGKMLAGFSYIQPWENETYVVNTGLIITPLFRGCKLAVRIKKLAIQLSAEKYPGAKLFSLTTSSPVMKVNADLGYKPVTYSALPTDKNFWDGCESCPNYKNLREKDYKMCFCTAMLLDNINKSLDDAANISEKWQSPREALATQTVQAQTLRLPL